MTPLTLREHVGEPANFWIRHSFSRWPAADDDKLWCDLATGVLATPTAVPASDALVAAELVRSATDVVYVPPLPANQASLRTRIVEAAATSGVPLLIQTVGNPPARGFTEAEAFGKGLADPPPNATVVIDLLDSLVRRPATLRERFREGRQPGLPFEPAPLQDATLVWPLVTGWTDRPGVLEAAMDRFAAARVRRVVPRALELSAADRRVLAECLQSTWPEAFDAIFHGDESPPDASAFRRVAEAAGLESRLPRPLPAPPLPPRLRLARELAGHLIERGDAADAGGDAYYRAARFLDRDEVDIDAAGREGNLGVLPWLEEPVKQAVERWLTARSGD
ncbi:MAG: hypothetical protein OXI49_10795 [Acidobacteriota bacterium]|nr:hypothetical protein [Acidobacteriota bacterium]